MQRFLDPEGMRSRGIEHFDGWAATFGEVVETMEISPDGKSSMRPRSRFAKFTNLPELQQMFRAFADVQTAEMLDLPRPRLEGGKPIIVACPMSEEQCHLQQKLVERYERLRSQKVDPRDDNALAITTDGRKLALDARMLSANADGLPGIESQRSRGECGRHLAEDRRHARHANDLLPTWASIPRPGVTRPTKRSPGNSLPAASPASRSPPSATPTPTPRNSPVRQGQQRCRSRASSAAPRRWAPAPTCKNAWWHCITLTAPWKPAEVEQREGRILRQGNENEEVAIYRYVTEGSFDAFMWQALETKARFISQVMTGDSGVRRAEDIGSQELSYAEVKAIASGNPAVLTLAEADAELQRLSVLNKNHADEQYLARRSLARAAWNHHQPVATPGRPHRRHGHRRRSCRRPHHHRQAATPHAKTSWLPWAMCLPPSLKRCGETPHPAGHLSRPAIRPDSSSAIRSRSVPRRSNHAHGHALTRASRPAGGAQCRRKAGRQLRHSVRLGQARPGDRRGTATRLPGPTRKTFPS